MALATASAIIARRCYQSKIARMVSKTARAVAGGALFIVLCACNAAPVPTPTPTSTTAPTALPTPEPTLAPAPTDTPQPQAEATAEASPSPATAAGAAQDFAPAQRSVWNTTIGPDQMTGDCAKGSVLPVYGLVQITPGEGSMEWKNQEPTPYLMQRLATNQYQYAGPNSINDGVVTMTLTFVDDKNLTMVREFTANAEPGCTHKHDYAGVFQWFR
jgi:hypothetical protein